MPLDRCYQGLDVTGLYGSYLLIIGPLLLFLFLMQEIGREKELRLRQGLNVVGVSHFAYWVHWLIIGTLMNLIQTFVMLGTGNLLKMSLWRNTSFFILF